MGMVALDNIDAVLTGKPAPSLVAAQTEWFFLPVYQLARFASYLAG